VPDQLHFNEEAVYQNLCPKFGKRKFCAEFATHIFMNEQKEHAVTTCVNFIQTCHPKPHSTALLLDVNPGCFSTILKQSVKSMEQRTKSSLTPIKLHLQKLWIRTMFNAFSDEQGVIHKEFVHEGKNIT
jgi:hypothetical protein